MPVQRPLTARQHVILRHIARGKTNKDIAAQLGISEQGVKVHISRLLERYGAENRVELVSLTRAWPEAEQYEDLSADVAGIRAGLNKTFQDATAFSDLRGGNGHTAAPAARPRTNRHGAETSESVVTGVRSLREVLGEINVALKLAREMSADADVRPLVDAIRIRVGAALEQSEKLDVLIDHDRSQERRPSQTAS